MLPRPEKQPVTISVLAISFVSLAIPVGMAFWLPEWTNSGYGILVWLTALIPAFLLPYYRGLSGVALALAGGMAVITATQLSIAMFDIAEPNWTLLLSIVGVYLFVSVGIAGLAEVLRRERRAAEDLALTDRLSGLPNRRQVDIVLAREFAAAERGHDLTVVVFDLDRFKQVNDKHGHAAGDATIRAFAKVLLANTRRENLSARYGGEEFVSILRDSTPEGARVFAQRVLDQFRAYPFDWGTQTVSAGIATYEEGMESHEEIISAGDRALYQAKEAGRDKLAIAQQARRRPAGQSGSPSRASKPSVVERRPAPEVPSARPGVSVFVVDHDDHARTELARALSLNGHSVWDTNDARAAIRRFAASDLKEQPDFVIVDLAMPELGGPRMIEVLSAISPGVRVIYLAASGVGRPSQMSGPGVVVETLRKPVSIEKVLETLDGAAGR